MQEMDAESVDIGQGIGYCKRLALGGRAADGHGTRRRIIEVGNYAGGGTTHGLGRAMAIGVTGADSDELADGPGLIQCVDHTFDGSNSFVVQLDLIG